MVHVSCVTWVPHPSATLVYGGTPLARTGLGITTGEEHTSFRGRQAVSTCGATDGVEESGTGGGKNPSGGDGRCRDVESWWLAAPARIASGLGDLFVKEEGTGEVVRDRATKGRTKLKSDELAGRYLRLASVFSCSLPFFWRSTALRLVDGDTEALPHWDGRERPKTANNLWLTAGCHETLDSKCWFLTVLLLSKHEMLVAVELLWFEFFMDLIIYHMRPNDFDGTCARYSLAMATNTLLFQLCPSSCPLAFGLPVVYV